MHVTFLQHRKPLTKIFSKEGTTNYPLAKNFTSHTETVISAQELYTVIIQHSKQNHCLYKGSLTKPIQNEPRAGLTDKAAPNQLLVMDIDGLTIPDYPVQKVVTEKNILNYAAKIIETLPANFHDTCYTVQASASLGQKGDSISLHFFFVLNKALSPAVHKDLFHILNLEIPLLQKNITLQPSGKTLHFPLDICMAQNSRIVYIAPPIFNDGLEDPVEVRTLFVHKSNSVVNIDSILAEMTIAQIAGKIKKTIKTLRKDADLEPATAHYTTLKSENGTIELLTNPDPMRLTMIRIDDDFAYFNINGGDSNAYYVKRSEPIIVHNFKSEAVFRFRDADPETYFAFLDKYTTLPETAKGVIPLIFRDIISDSHWNGFYNTETTEIISLHKADKGNLGDFMSQHGHIMPEIIQSLDYDFKPKIRKGVMLNDGWVNRFVPTDLMKDETKIENADIGYTTGMKLEGYCPIIFKILAHTFNNSEEELKHFINWLCYIIKVRDKTQTAWVISGIPGTGKGVFFNNVIRPILGDTLFSCLMPQVEDNFKGWVSTSLLAVIDEFSMDAIKGKSDPIVSWLKSTITDPYGVARSMRTDPTSTKNYLNFVFLSNRYDAMRIEQGDRRFNVAPRQEQKLNIKFPNIDDEIQDRMPTELPIFMRFINAYQINEKAVHQVLENETKKQMYSTTETSTQEFGRSIRDGNLGYFIENVLNVNDNHMDPFIIAAKDVVKTWLRALTEKQKTVFASELTAVYSAMTGKTMQQSKLISLLQHHGIKKPTRMRRGEFEQKLGWKINFTLDDGYNLAELIKQHFTKTDTKFLTTLSVIQNDLDNEGNNDKIP